VFRRAGKAEIKVEALAFTMLRQAEKVEAEIKVEVPAFTLFQRAGKGEGSPPKLTPA